MPTAAKRRWLGWQDSNLQYQSQSLVCYRYTTSHHRLVQRGRHCRPPAFLGWEMGLEPTTPGTTIRCSYQLSYTHHLEPCLGTPGGTRTPGLLLRRQLLYPYIAGNWLQHPAILPGRARKPSYLTITKPVCQACSAQFSPRTYIFCETGTGY